MKKLFTLLTMLIVAITSSWADEVTVTSFKSSSSTPYTYECISNNYAVNEVEIITSDVASNPVGNNQLKVPANGTLTVSAHGKSVTGIEISWKNTPNITANVGEISTDSKVTTWTGNAESVVLTSTTANQFGTITVTYAGTFADNIGSTVTLSSLTRGLYNSSSIYTIGCTTDPSVYGVYMKGKIGSDINIDTQSNSGTISFKSPKAMSSIVLNWTDSKGASKNPNMTPSIGTYDATTKTWSAPSGNTSIKEVTFTNAETSKYYLKNQNVVINFASSGPSLSVDPAEANAFTYVAGNGPSAAQEFTVNLSNSEKAVSATLDSENYEMSKTSDGTYASTAITDLENGSKVYVRLKAGLAKGTGYDGTLTFANDDVTDDVVVSLSGSVTGVAYAISTTTPENGSIAASATSAVEDEEITLTATPDFRYALSAWNVYKTGEPATTVTVTNNKFTMPAYAVTVDATFAADPNKQVLYVTGDGSVSNDDQLYSALSEDYTVTVAKYDASISPLTVTSFDLVVLHESIGGSNYNASLVAAAKSGNVPVLNTKAFFYTYNSDSKKNRWGWGTPNAGNKELGCTMNAAYSNIANHPIFEGITPGFISVVTGLSTSDKDKAMQPVGTIREGKEGYVLATALNSDSGNGAAIHELTPAQRGVESAKYLLISLHNECFNKMTADGIKLFKNAAAYLMGAETWTPALATTNITLNAKGFATYSNANDFTFSGAKAYKMALDETAKTITGTEVTGKIQAGAGILLKGKAGATVTITGATWATALEDNSLKGTTKADGSKAAKPEFCYTLSGETFKKFTGAAFNDNKAYFEASQDLKGQSFEIIFDDEATAISFVVEDDANVAAAPVKVIKNGQLFIGNYNVAGQLVK